MAKKKRFNKRNNFKQTRDGGDPVKYPILTTKLRRLIAVVVLAGFVLVLCFAFFEKAGRGGAMLFRSLDFVIGNAVYFLPALLILAAFLIFKPQKKRVVAPTVLAVLFLVLSVAGIFGAINPSEKQGGALGYILGKIFLFLFGNLLAFIIFAFVILVALLIVREFLPKKKSFLSKQEKSEEQKQKQGFEKREEKKVEKPQFVIKPLSQGKQGMPFARGFGFSGQGHQDLSRTFGGKYKRPGLELLDTSEEKPSSGDINYNSLVIKKTLQNFGLEVDMAEVNIGPTVTQYTLKPAEGVKLAKITGLNNDLALALASHPIRIEAPIPGRALVGVEVPNKSRVAVKLGNLFSSDEFQKAIAPLTLALGKDVMGSNIFADLGGMPHFLVAGATGSGKTICLNSLITSLIFRNSPKILRLILIDPKRVEFPVYSKLPHLLTPVIFNPQKAVNALNWLVSEMERRFDILKEAGVRDILSFNKAIKERIEKRASQNKIQQDDDSDLQIMPYIVLIIDELADLMLTKGREVEAAIVRLSQLARAVGIHLLVATQRPSVEVITGLIKANITSRIAFQVASQIDSRTILDTAGAEKLLGRGDMLFLSSEFSKPKRIQGAYISAGEIKRVVNFIEKENPLELQEQMVKDVSENITKERELDFTDAAGDDVLYEEAKKVVLEYKKASASLLQRRLKIGYARAARLLDILEENNVIGPADGAKPREVLLGGPTKDILDDDDELDSDGFQDPGKLEFQ